MGGLTPEQTVGVVIAMLGGGGLVGAVITNVITHLFARGKTKADVTGVITDAFKDLTADLRIELTRSQDDNKGLRGENSTMRGEMQALRDQVRLVTDLVHRWAYWADAVDRGEMQPRPSLDITPPSELPRGPAPEDTTSVP